MECVGCSSCPFAWVACCGTCKPIPFGAQGLGEGIPKPSDAERGNSVDFDACPLRALPSSPNRGTKCVCLPIAIGPVPALPHKSYLNAIHACPFSTAPFFLLLLAAYLT